MMVGGRAIQIPKNVYLVENNPIKSAKGRCKICIFADYEVGPPC
jgi:hypothetical protein